MAVIIIRDDELLKAACHGIVLGAVLPVLTYNLKCRHWVNATIYVALIALETYHIVIHLKET